jgi:hypothetical protein
MAVQASAEVELRDRGLREPELREAVLRSAPERRGQLGGDLSGDTEGEKQGSLTGHAERGESNFR